MRPSPTAWHEAGHSVLALELGLTCKSATVLPGHGTQGEVTLGGWASDPAWDQQLLQQARAHLDIMVTLAGPMAEELASGRRGDSAATMDRCQVWDQAKELTSDDEEARLLLAWLERRCRSWLNDPRTWLKVQNVADALEKKKTLTGADVAKVCTTASRTPRW